MEFTPRQLLSILNQLPDAGRYWVGYSGGLDSHVLLHAMAALRAALAPREMLAIHVDHGLSPHARTWAGHCQAVCRELGMPCEVVAVDARPQNGEGPEAAARRARYAAISDAMKPAWRPMPRSAPDGTRGHYWPLHDSHCTDTRRRTDCPGSRMRATPM